MILSPRPLLIAAFSLAWLCAAPPLRADDAPAEEEAAAEPEPEKTEDAPAAAPAPAAKKPAKSRSGGQSAGQSGGGSVPSGRGGVPLVSDSKADKPAGDDWLHTPEGPDTPARHRKTTVPIIPPEDTGSNSMETFVPFRSVANGESCYQASKIFVLWQQWHFRRMNRVADNSSGCAGVPVAEQAKIRLIQARNGAAFEKMDKLSSQRVGDHGPFDDHCDEIIAVYRDNLAWSNLAMFFKGRYMTRCAPASTVGESWPRECPNDPVTGLAVPRPLCSPPLPKG